MALPSLRFLSLSSLPRFALGRTTAPLIALSLIPFAALPTRAAGTVNWTGNAGTGFWDTTGNWNPAALPGALDDVFNLIGASINHRSGNDTINSLTTNGNILVSGGTLSIATSLTFNSGGSLTLSGGTLAGAQVSNSTLLSFSGSQTSVLRNVSLIGDGTTILNGTNVRIADSFSFSNGNVFNIGVLVFDSTAGNPNPTFDNASINPGGGNGNFLLGFGQGYAAGNTLTLGSNLLVQGGGTIGYRSGYFAAPGANLVNNGTISSTGLMNVAGDSNGNITNNGMMKLGTSNATLAITTTGTGTFTNNGTILITGTGLASSINGSVATLGTVSVTGSGAVLNLNADLTTSQLAGLTVSGGGRINLGGGLTNRTLNNTGATLDIAHFVGANGQNGTLYLNTYTIQGGTITNSQLLSFSTTGANFLDNVALVGDGTTILNVGNTGFTSYAHLANTVSFSNGSVFNVGKNNSTGNPGYLFLDSTTGVPNPTLDSATVNLGEAGGNGYLVFGNGYSTGRTLTLGSNLLVQGQGTIGDYVPSNAAGAHLINNGTITANIGNGTLNVLGTTNGNLTNNGTIQTGAANNTLNITTSGTGVFTNNGVIKALNGSTVNIRGTTALLGTVTAANGSKINLSGTLQNTGRTLDVESLVGTNGVNGSFSFDGATINGGTILNSHLIGFLNTANSTNVLSNVSLSGDGTNVLRIGDSNAFTSNPTVRIADSFQFTKGSVFTLGAGTNNGFLLFDSTAGTPNPTFDKATVNLGGSSASGVLGFGNGYTTGKTLTLGSNLVVQGRQGLIGGSIQANPTGVNLVNNGTIQSNVAGGLLSLTGGNGGTITNNGTLQANASGSSVAIRLTNGTGSIAFVNNGLFSIAAGSTASISNAQSALQSGGSTVVDGSLSLITGSTTYVVNGGTLGGKGSVTGSINNAAGKLLPGGAGGTGTFTLSGNYTQGSAALFSSEIGGETQGSLYDFFSVGGNAALGGNLSVSLLNNFVPTVGSQFQIIAYGSNTGNTTFSNPINSQIVTSDGSYRFNVVYQSNGVYLQAAGNAAPEPASLFFVLPSLIPGTCLLLRRRCGPKTAALPKSMA